MIDMKALRNAGALLAVALAASLATADEPPARAKVTGWIGQPLSIPVYTHDGTPRGREDLSATPMSGVRDWNRTYSLVKLSTDPRDDRWVPTKYVNIVFCEHPDPPRVVHSDGRGESTSAISAGSGRSCGQ